MAEPSAHDDQGHATQGPALQQGTRPRRLRRTLVFLTVCLLTTGVLGLLALQLFTPAQQSRSGGASSPLLGHPAPDFTLPRLGVSPPETLRLSSLKGKPVILNFWASWCDPCKQEAPLLEQTWRRVQAQGVLLLGVDFEDSEAAGTRFLHQYGITYPNVIDRADGATGIAYGLSGVPETFFLDREGIVIHKEIGELSAVMLQRDLHLFGVSLSQLSEHIPVMPTNIVPMLASIERWKEEGV